MDRDDCWDEDMQSDGDDYAEELDRERRAGMKDEDGNALYDPPEDEEDEDEGDGKKAREDMFLLVNGYPPREADEKEKGDA